MRPWYNSGLLYLSVLAQIGPENRGRIIQFPKCRECSLRTAANYLLIHEDAAPSKNNDSVR